MNKIPFYFDGSTINASSNFKEYKQIKHGYEKIYETIELLEPSVKFFPCHKIFPLTKYMKLHRNLECRNFYKISKGSALFICIHPKYKTLFKYNNNTFECSKETIKYIKTNSTFIHILLQKDQILFLPNYWLMFITTKDNCIIEKIQYSTILNQTCLLLS